MCNTANVYQSPFPSMQLKLLTPFLIQSSHSIMKKGIYLKSADSLFSESHYSKDSRKNLRKMDGLL